MDGGVEAVWTGKKTEDGAHETRPRNDGREKKAKGVRGMKVQRRRSDNEAATRGSAGMGKRRNENSREGRRTGKGRQKIDYGRRRRRVKMGLSGPQWCPHTHYYILTHTHTCLLLSFTHTHTHSCNVPLSPPAQRVFRLRGSLAVIRLHIKRGLR